MNLNLSPSHFDHHDHQTHHPFSPNIVFLNSTDQDHNAGYNYHHHLYQSQYHQQDELNYTYNHSGSSSYDTTNKVETTALNLSLWNNEEDHLPPTGSDHNDIPTGKWITPTKIKLKQKKKNPDQKLQASGSLESSSTISYNNITNSPIRVCTDCNTTKTPLWRSGPKGPKSLCNACGIRQRKARRAMAALTGGGTEVATESSPPMKIKKEKKGKINGFALNSKFKKRGKITSNAANVSGSSSNGQKKLDLEDFLINLSKNLAYQRVFPKEEKDAAILLMAISSGLIHG